MTWSRATQLIGGRAGMLASVLALGACSMPREYEPVVDMTGHTKAQYGYDLDVCRDDAKEMDVLKGVGIGVLAGAAIGGATGALTGDAGTGALIGIAGGAIAGGTAGAASGQVRTAMTGQDPHEAFVRDCLARRGYTVLDSPASAPNIGPQNSGPANAGPPDDGATGAPAQPKS